MSARHGTRLIGAAAAAAALLAGGAGTLAGAVSTPVVQTMVVGSRGQLLAGPRSVGASAASVTVGHRRCAVAAATPLAVLADARGPSFAVRDYGHCGSAPANSSSLFVYEVDGEANRGRSGWEYKVDNVSGSTGAGDPSGAEGNGRLLRSGDRVLWFYCHAAGGGCQRTLALSVPATAARGGRLAVKVLAYDNEGRAVAAGGAIVTLGSDFASTSASGHATLIVPGHAGRYTVSAKRSGLVPAFPVSVTVP